MNGIPLRRVEPQTVRLPEGDTIPNHPFLPVLLYRQVLETVGAETAHHFEALFARNRWQGIWRDGIFTFPHYHSTAHEVLGIAAGRVHLRLGGACGPSLEARAGDVLLLPAGTGHQNLGASPDLLVVGAYPPGQRWDLLRGAPGEREASIERIRRVPLPDQDPVYGVEGPLRRLWTR